VGGAIVTPSVGYPDRRLRRELSRTVWVREEGRALARCCLQGRGPSPRTEQGGERCSHSSALPSMRQGVPRLLHRGVQHGPVADRHDVPYGGEAAAGQRGGRSLLLPGFDLSATLRHSWTTPPLGPSAGGRPATLVRCDTARPPITPGRTGQQFAIGEQSSGAVAASEPVFSPSECSP
jgi:hypothetical protein